MIARVALRALVNCLAGGTVLLGLTVLGTPVPEESPGPVAETADTRAARGAARVSGLLETYECWSGPAPAGSPEPRHAVVTEPGGEPRLVDAAVGFGIWLEGAPGVLHGFCP